MEEEILLRIYISSLGHCVLIHEEETFLYMKCVCIYNFKRNICLFAGVPGIELLSVSCVLESCCYYGERKLC